MGKSAEKLENEGGWERAAKVYRNYNAIATLAFAGAALIAPPVISGVLVFGAGLNAVQTAGGEAVRRHQKKKRTKK